MEECRDAFVDEWFQLPDGRQGARGGDDALVLLVLGRVTRGKNVLVWSAFVGRAEGVEEGGLSEI